MNPADRKYTKSHEWVKFEGDVAVIGLTDFAQKSMGDVTWVELPKVAAKVKQGESFAVVESVKAAGDVYAPVSGEIAAVNEALAGDPSAVNADPYGAGWLVKVSGFGPDQGGGLLDSDEYTRLTQVEK